MVERNLSNIPQVTKVTPDTSAGTMESAIGEAGQEIIKAQQHSMIVNNFSKAYMDLNDAKLKFQNDYADNPMEGVKAYQQYREETLNSYGDQISPFFRGVWNQESKSMGIRDDMQMNGWAYGQLRQNTVTNVNNAISTNLGQANTDGMNYGSGKISDIDAVLQAAPERELLNKFGGSNLGAAKTSGLLQNYDSDYFKSFISGVAQTNPQKAAALLDSDMFKNKFTTDDRNEFAALIEKTQKSNELISSLKITQNTQQVTDMINDPGQTFYQKRLTLDTMEQQGAISNTAAANARRVLTSKDAVDAVTDAPVMADITKRIYDLNQQSGMNNTDYLMGVQNLHNEILDQQAQGKLNASDVQKMNNEMKTLTSARVASATKSVGGDMYEAVEKFDALPPEYRGEATRQLFYKTQGQMATLSPEAYRSLTISKAQEVIDNINAERRQTAVSAVNQAAQSDMQQQKKPETQQKEDTNGSPEHYEIENEDGTITKGIRFNKNETTPEAAHKFAPAINPDNQAGVDAANKVLQNGGSQEEAYKAFKANGGKLYKQLNDEQFLKKIQTSPEEVQKFARSKNVPVSRVMDALRKKYPQ